MSKKTVIPEEMHKIKITCCSYHRNLHELQSKKISEQAEQIRQAKLIMEDVMDYTDGFTGGDDIQMGATGLYDIPWDLSGADVNIPLNSTLVLSGNGRILLGAVDATIVAITRLNSRDMSHFITKHDSLRIYGLLQQIFTYLMTFAGDENRIDVAQVLPTEEPRGPGNAPNRRTETTDGGPSL